MTELEKRLKTKGHDKLCASAIMFKDEKILIGFRHYGRDKWKKISVWTCPGGRCDDGEFVEQTLRREVAEEVGIINFTINEFLGEFPGAKEGDILYLFKCSTDEEFKLMEPEKFSEWRWSMVNNIPDNFINPKVIGLIQGLI